MAFLWKALAAFAIGFLCNVLRVLFTRRAAAGLAAGAATYNTFMLAIGVYGTILYVGEPRLTWPLLAGCWLGTFVSVRIDQAAGPATFSKTTNTTKLP